MFIEGFVQEVQYDPETSQTSRLYFNVQRSAADTVADATAPTIAVYEPGGDARVTATAMSETAADGTGWLRYDAESAGFTASDSTTTVTLTGGTSSATAKIESVRDLGTTGVLELSSISGTFQDNEAITDDATGSGAAVANGTPITSLCYYDLDASNTTSFPAAEGFRADVVFTTGSEVYRRTMTFDVVMFPLGDPLVTTETIDELHPDWKREHPDGPDGTWVTWIERAHAVLAARIRAMGKRARCIIKREEIYPIALAMAEEAIAKALPFGTDERKFFIGQSKAAWESRGEFYYEDDDDPELDDGDERTLTTKWTR